LKRPDGSQTAQPPIYGIRIKIRGKVPSKTGEIAHVGDRQVPCLRMVPSVQAVPLKSPQGNVQMSLLLQTIVVRVSVHANVNAKV